MNRARDHAEFAGAHVQSAAVRESRVGVGHLRAARQFARHARRGGRVSPAHAVGGDRRQRHRHRGVRARRRRASTSAARKSASLAAERLTQAYGAYGVMVEPNIFGSFTAATLVLSAVLLAGLPRDGSATKELRARRRGPPARRRWGSCCRSRARRGWARRSVSCAASWQRAADGRATGVGEDWRKPLAVVVGGDSRAAARARTAPARSFDSSCSTWSICSRRPPCSGCSRTRWRSTRRSVHPLVGWGTFTFAPLAAQGTDFQQFENWRNLWIGNFVLLALHDTGAIGLALWGGMLWSVLARGVRAAASLRPVDRARVAPRGRARRRRHQSAHSISHDDRILARLPVAAHRSPRSTCAARVPRNPRFRSRRRRRVRGFLFRPTRPEHARRHAAGD